MPQQQAMENGQFRLKSIHLPKFDWEIFSNAFCELIATEIVLCFIFYFLGGLFDIRSALCRNRNQAVDAPSDAQQFMLPVTIPE